MLDFARTHPVFPILAERRDIDPVRKIETRNQLRGQIARLLSHGSPLWPLEQRETAAALVLLVMKAAVSLAYERDEADAGSLITQLQGMLRRHLAAEL